MRMGVLSQTKIDAEPRANLLAKRRMKPDSKIESLLDEWENWLEQYPNASLGEFVTDHCAWVSESVVDEFREKAGRLVSIDQKLFAVQNADNIAVDRETTKGLRIQDLQSGTAPIPGYTLISRLGVGGFGEVWKAVGPGGFHVALKFVPLNERVGRIELRALDVIRDIRHANLLSHFGTWTTENLLIIATELADKTLLDRLQESQVNGNEGIPPVELLRYMEDAARGIDFLNEPLTAGRIQVQHRDIKPQNLLLSGGSVKIGDFGLARSLESDATGHTGSLTMAYAAPECFDGTTSYRSDQYSLAISYCYLRGGRLPFVGTQFEVIDGHRCKTPDLSMLPECERVAVARALSKQPKDRWQNSTTFIQSLRASIDRPGLPVELNGSKEKPKSRRKAYVWFFASIVAIAVIWTMSIFSNFFPSNQSNSGSESESEVENVASKNNNSDAKVTILDNAPNGGGETVAVTRQPDTVSAPSPKPNQGPKVLKEEVVTSDDAADFLSDPK